MSVEAKATETASPAADSKEVAQTKPVGIDGQEEGAVDEEEEDEEEDEGSEYEEDVGIDQLIAEEDLADEPEDADYQSPVNATEDPEPELPLEDDEEDDGGASRAPAQDLGPRKRQKTSQ